MRPVTPTAPTTTHPAASPDSSTCSTTPLAGGAGYRQLPGGARGTINGTAAPPTSQHHNKTSTRIAVLIFFKGLFGAGVLAIPGAFESTGVPLGLLIFLAVSCLCLGTMLMLLRCKVSCTWSYSFCLFLEWPLFLLPFFHFFFESSYF